MANTYNGRTNRATWLVNVWGSPESRQDVEFLKETIEQEYVAMPGGILKDMIDINEINWSELLEHFEEEEEEDDEE